MRFMKKKLSKSLRKHIRKEKARIRRQILDFKEQEGQISELYKKFLRQHEDTRNIQPSNK